MRVFNWLVWLCSEGDNPKDVGVVRAWGLVRLLPTRAVPTRAVKDLLLLLLLAGKS